MCYCCRYLAPRLMSARRCTNCTSSWRVKIRPRSTSSKVRERMFGSTLRSVCRCWERWPVPGAVGRLGSPRTFTPRITLICTVERRRCSMWFNVIRCGVTWWSRAELVGFPGTGSAVAAVQQRRLQVEPGRRYVWECLVRANVVEPSPVGWARRVAVAAAWRACG